MLRAWLALAVLCAGTARAAGPSYTADGIVNASSYASGPFAPNSILSIFGTGLARSTQAAPAGATVPTELNYVRVYVQDQLVPLLFVSETQVNFIMSSVQKPGPVQGPGGHGGAGAARKSRSRWWIAPRRCFRISMPTDTPWRPAQTTSC